MSDYELRMIVGMPRSGTTSVIRALNLRGDVVAFGETGFFGLPSVNKRKLVTTTLQKEMLSNFLLKKYISPWGGEIGDLAATQESMTETARRHLHNVKLPCTNLDIFTAFSDGVAEANNISIWIEKTPHHLMHLDCILHYDSGARIVAMIRSPYDFVLSYKHQGDRKPENKKSLFRSLYHPAISSYICRKYLLAACRATDTYPDNVMLVRHEHLGGGSVELLEHIQRHFGLAYKQGLSIPVSNSSFSLGEKPELNSADLLWLWIMCRGPAKEVGYILQSQSIFSRVFITSSLSLLWWPIRNASFLFGDFGRLKALAYRWIGG